VLGHGTKNTEGEEIEEPHDLVEEDKAVTQCIPNNNKKQRL
jgi:hypothetical protein